MMPFYLIMLTGVAAGYYGGIGLLKLLGKPDGAVTPVAGSIAGGIAAYLIAVTIAPPIPSGDIVWDEPVRQVFSQEELTAVLEEAPGEPTVVDFYADWCPPCRQEAPGLNELALAGHRIVVVDVDQVPSLADIHNVYGLPTTIIFVNAREVHREEGYVSKGALQKRLRAAAES